MKRKRCGVCRRHRLIKFLEWHPGVGHWQCRNFSECDAAKARKEKR